VRNKPEISSTPSIILPLDESESSVPLTKEIVVLQTLNILTYANKDHTSQKSWVAKRNIIPEEFKWLGIQNLAEPTPVHIPLWKNLYHQHQFITFPTSV
jgi:hypothetical protein